MAFHRLLPFKVMSDKPWRGRYLHDMADSTAKGLLSPTPYRCGCYASANSRTFILP